MNGETGFLHSFGAGRGLRIRGELASGAYLRGHRLVYGRIGKKPLSQFIFPPRAQASRRCETQATLGGKPPSYASVSVP